MLSLWTDQHDVRQRPIDTKLCGAQSANGAELHRSQWWWLESIPVSIEPASKNNRKRDQASPCKSRIQGILNIPFHPPIKVLLSFSSYYTEANPFWPRGPTDSIGMSQGRALQLLPK